MQQLLSLGAIDSQQLPCHSKLLNINTQNSQPKVFIYTQPVWKTSQKSLRVKTPAKSLQPVTKGSQWIFTPASLPLSQNDLELYSTPSPRVLQKYLAQVAHSGKYFEDATPLTDFLFSLPQSPSSHWCLRGHLPIKLLVQDSLLVLDWLLVKPKLKADINSRMNHRTLCVRQPHQKTN